MKSKRFAYDFVLFALIICAGIALIIFQGSPGVIDDTPSLPGLASGEILLPQNIAQTNRKIVEQVEINAENVQNVVRTLIRPANYRSEGTVSYYSGPQVIGSYYVKSWVRPGMCKIELYSQTGAQQKLLKNTVLSASHVYIWETAADTLYIGSAGDFTPDDLGHVPTYEQVLGFPADSITGGNLDGENGVISVESKNPQTGFTEKWKIDIDTGLLIEYQCHQNGELASRVELSLWSVESIDNSIFALPNGQVAE